ncbi:MAG: NUDIX hydrolase [Chloroflexi bacterium]|nr:NUDIX hydrolase [Chloroflexota bacterium]
MNNIAEIKGNSLVTFCSDCGATLKLGEFEQRQRDFCPQCGRIHYAQLKVGAGALIEQNGKLLLIQRTSTPFQHSWNLPAGYSEVDESPRQTVIREVYEETGLRVEPEVLVDIYFFTDDPRGNGILIVYKCHPIDGELRATREGANPTFFTARKIPKNLSGGGHDQAVCAWQKNERAY